MDARSGLLVWALAPPPSLRRGRRAVATGRAYIVTQCGTVQPQDDQAVGQCGVDRADAVLDKFRTHTAEVSLAVDTLLVDGVRAIQVRHYVSAYRTRVFCQVATVA